MFLLRQARSVGLAVVLSLLLTSLTTNRVCVVIAAVAAGEEGSNSNKQCSIYMAKSSLKGHTGFGLYTTRDIPHGQGILSGPPDTPDGPTVAVIDSSQNVPNELQPVLHQWHHTWGNYWWGRGVPDHVGFETNTGDVLDYQILFGALPNHQCVLQSIDMVWPESPYEDSLLSRYEDPGAGSYSYHRGRVFQATRNVQAGSELFLSYGYCGDDNGLHYPDWARSLPMRNHYLTATNSIRSLWKELVAEFGSAEKIPNNLEFDPAPDMEAQVAQLIPRNMEMLKRVINHPAVASKHFDRAIAEEMLTEKRTVEWIQENGLCVEHLIPAPSTLPQAGQGGFAQHKIKKGEIVVPAPLLQIADREVLNMYDDEGNVKGKQLLLNYCFGHKDTSLLLCPDTNAILINHCSTKTNECGKGPNAKFQWASWDPDTPSWLEMSVDEILQNLGRGLSIEIVALRDIEPGEEVFMDYGPEWEEAWNAYTKAWTPPEDGREYKSAKKLNEDPDGLKSFVSNDLKTEVEHPYLFTACAYFPGDADDDEIWEESAGMDLDAMSDDEMLETFADDGSEFLIDHKSHGDGTYWPCALLYENTEEGKSTYTVRIIERDYHDYGEMSWAVHAVPRLLVNYPKESIHIFVKPHQSDQHLPNTFRHYIPLPDEMLPDVWRNLQDGVRQTRKRIVRSVSVSRRAFGQERRDDEEDDDEEEEE